MSLFGEKDANVEEISRHNRIKKSITKHVATTLKTLQKEYRGAASPDGNGGGDVSDVSASQQPIYSGDLPSHLCLCIEAIFLHGLKKVRFRKKLSGYFGGDSSSGANSDPQLLSFWSFVVKFTHKDTVSQLKRCQHLKNEAGLCRAWVRIALNDSLAESYLAAMLGDNDCVASYYRPVAYLRDVEQPGILLGLLRGLSELRFSLNYNMLSLNAWTTGALAIAGLVESVSSPPTITVAASAASAAQPYLAASAAPTSADMLSGGTVLSSSSSLKGIREGLSARCVEWDVEPCAVDVRESPSLDTSSLHTAESGAPLSFPYKDGQRSGLIAAADNNSYESSRDSHDAWPATTLTNADTYRDTGGGSCSREEHHTWPADTSSTLDEHLGIAGGGSSHEEHCDGDASVDREGQSALSGATPSGRYNPFNSPDARSLAELDMLGACDSGSLTDADDKHPLSSFPHDGNVEGITARWSVPRTLLEPVTGNSLGSLNGWATAQSPAAVFDFTERTVHHQDDSASADGLPVEGGSSDAIKATPTGSLEYAASFDQLMRDSRPAHASPSLEQELPQSSLPAAALDSAGFVDGKNCSSGGGVPQSKRSPSPLGKRSLDGDFEVLEPYDVQLVDDLSNYYGKICNEQGLDFQNYQCKSCTRPVGIVYGAPRVCTYDGCYYCTECHLNEEYLIPSKVIFNWDFKKYRVSTTCRAFLLSVEDQPLLSVSHLNAKLYDHVPELKECRVLRVELCYLRKYLFQCSHQVAEDLKRKVWPNEFLYEDPDTYSMTTLTRVMPGQLAAMLRKAIVFAKGHVYDCAICRQKGFFCELCGSSKVIFPFETDTTVQCDKCHSVCHTTCRRNAAGCPKCARIRKRQSVLGPKEMAAQAARISLY